MQSKFLPAAFIISVRSSLAQGLLKSFIRTVTSRLPKPPLSSSAITFARASFLAAGDTESSRSRKIASTGSCRDFSIMRGLLPGTAKVVRRIRVTALVLEPAMS